MGTDRDQAEAAAKGNMHQIQRSQQQLNQQQLFLLLQQGRHFTILCSRCSSSRYPARCSSANPSTHLTAANKKQQQQPGHEETAVAAMTARTHLKGKGVPNSTPNRQDGQRTISMQSQKKRAKPHLQIQYFNKTSEGRQAKASPGRNSRVAHECPMGTPKGVSTEIRRKPLGIGFLIAR